MPRSASQLRRDALQIWQAGVEAVRSDRLVRQALRVDGRTVQIGDHCRLPLDEIRRIVVVGAGKAGAGMAEAVEGVLGPQRMAEKQLTGWVNVPADCVRPLQRIHLHAARPAGVNEPTAEGVAGAEEILRLVASLGPDDLCLCLISGGGSALMPAPVEGISLADKLAVTRHLSAAGANIEQLNAVRKQLSRLKGGGLLRACRAGRLASLVISDVLGDPLDIIASGPTVPDSSTPQGALDVLERFDARAAGISPAVFAHLENSRELTAPGEAAETAALDARVINLIIGNNATAVSAAGNEAQQLGYSVTTESAAQSEGPTEEVGRRLARRSKEPTPRPWADVPGQWRRAGGQAGRFIASRTGRAEPTIGTRCVAAFSRRRRKFLSSRNAPPLQWRGDGIGKSFSELVPGVALLSGGTDGEDGPTDAAGAFFDADIMAAAREKRLDAADYLARNDAYHFFAPLGALLKTGPTHTNVCDVRVVLTDG